MLAQLPYLLANEDGCKGSVDRVGDMGELSI